MSRWLAGLRGILRGSDEKRAYANESKAVIAARDVPSLPPGFTDQMSKRESASLGACLGHTIEAPITPIRVEARDLLRKSHAVILGATGSGKTRLALLFLADLYRRRAAGEDVPVPWVIDHKGEFAPLAEALAGQVELSVRAFDPFEPDLGLPFQVLLRDPDPRITVDVQAFEVLTLLERATNADLGVKQDLFVHHLLVLGIEAGLHLPALAELTFDSIRLVSEASRSNHEGVRRYFAGKARLPEASLEGVRARLHRLLRLPTTRAMLSASSCTNLRNTLASTPLIANLGRVPHGAEDIGRFWSALFTTKLARAIFDRDPTDPGVIIFIDEWQEGLLSGPDVAEQYERLLSMARSRAVSFVLISQSLAGAAKVSGTLPKMVATNTDLQFMGRVSPEDARLMKSILPVTGRRRREAPAPWEKSGSTFLASSEEVELLVHEAANLPHRTFWFFHRGAHSAIRFRTADAPSAVPGGGSARGRSIEKSGLRRAGPSISRVK